jgi:hypothetical protein
MNKNAHERIMECLQDSFASALRGIDEDTDWIKECHIGKIRDEPYICITEDEPDVLTVDVFDDYDMNGAVDVSIETLVNQLANRDLSSALAAISFFRKAADLIELEIEKP